jgi:hypothetical protein
MGQLNLSSAASPFQCLHDMSSSGIFFIDFDQLLDLSQLISEQGLWCIFRVLFAHVREIKRLV